MELASRAQKRATGHVAIDSSATPSIRNDGAVQQLTQEQFEAKEWKYTGYRTFSQFISSDNDFFILRRFGALNARVILALQDEITVLEQELAALDEVASQESAPDVHNGSFRADSGSRRLKLLRNDIYKKLKNYSKLRLITEYIPECS